MLRTIGSLALLVFYAWAIFMPRADASGSADELRALAERSRTLLQAGRHADALAPALTLREAHPANLVYLKQLATIYGQLGRSREEAEAWESFVASAPSPEEACPYIADAYVRQGLVKASVDAFERCLVFDPDNPDAMLSLARAIERANLHAHVRCTNVASRLPRTTRTCAWDWPASTFGKGVCGRHGRPPPS